MSEEKFDAIIVGGGVAGSTAAYVLAKEGLNVLIIERGNYSGSKNVTGGRLYTHSLEKIIPGFAEEAPVERKVAKERISMMTNDSAMTVEYASSCLGKQGHDSYVVLRGKFDRWLFGKAEEAGAMAASGIRVDELIVKDGRISGIRCGDDEMEADVVILADGVNSLLAENTGLKKRIIPSQVSIGVKETYALSSQVIEERFGLTGNEGLSWLFAGAPTDGIAGGGFLYTNMDSISIGIVVGLGHIGENNKTVTEMINAFESHPLVAPLIRDGKLVEYSGHVVPEAGLSMVPQLSGNGYLICGDAAGLCINVGYMVRGMDLAITSGALAAKTVIDAKNTGDYSETKLKYYDQLLADSYVMKDLKTYKGIPDFMENPRIFNDYPKMITDIMGEMFVVDGNPSKPMHKIVKNNLKSVGFMNLIKDALKGAVSL
ncbi:FAD-dependent oxidoreductase [Pectinatus frisingensis]|uniref:FAD-dependent oxidoreductase n=1 Tax=Pectinatus frisingensis TaxID=865 RepID=UPI0018C6EAF8|nr:FAD-dependent oxidoreductase [Pectinatus frisingensis]